MTGFSMCLVGLHGKWHMERGAQPLAHDAGIHSMLDQDIKTSAPTFVLSRYLSVMKRDTRIQ